jgi:hypothetical protein
MLHFLKDENNQLHTSVDPFFGAICNENGEFGNVDKIEKLCPDA